MVRNILFLYEAITKAKNGAVYENLGKVEKTIFTNNVVVVKVQIN